MSDIVFDSVKDKLAPHFEDLGPQQEKNVGETVRAYRIVSILKTPAKTVRPLRR